MYIYIDQTSIQSARLQTMQNESIQDELTSINSIFDQDTLLPIDEDARTYSLRLPTFPSITIRIEFPLDYPETPISILGTQSVGQDVPKGMGSRAVHVMRSVLEAVYHPGEVCIYDLLEEVKQALEEAEEQGDIRLHDHMEIEPIQEKVVVKTPLDSAIDLGPEPPWTIGPPLSEKKSVFLARVAEVSSPTQAKQYVARLLATDRKAARATHNITAWRIKGANDTSFQDCDDDGETAAGSRMLHLMQLMDVWNVMVVVTRWYGGILLGPDRFRIINSAAREALVLGGFAKETKENDTKKKGPR